MAPSAELTQKWPCFILYISRFLILYHHNNNGRVSLVRERPPKVEVQIKRRKPLAVFNLHLKEKEKNEQRNERHIDEYFVTFSPTIFLLFRRFLYVFSSAATTEIHLYFFFQIFYIINKRTRKKENQLYQSPPLSRLSLFSSLSLLVWTYSGGDPDSLCVISLHGRCPFPSATSKENSLFFYIYISFFVCVARITQRSVSIDEKEEKQGQSHPMQKKEMEQKFFFFVGWSTGFSNDDRTIYLHARTILQSCVCIPSRGNCTAGTCVFFLKKLDVGMIYIFFFEKNISRQRESLECAVSRNEVKTKKKFKKPRNWIRFLLPPSFVFVLPATDGGGESSLRDDDGLFRVSDLFFLFINAIQ